MVDYTVPGSQLLHQGERLETAMKECCIRIIRKKRVFPDGRVFYATSIWSFSYDGEVRLEQQGMFLTSHFSCLLFKLTARSSL
jgi:hypothetical protein